MTAEPVRGFSGTRHFGIPEDSNVYVSRVRGNAYGDERRFITVELLDLGLHFVFDAADIPEGAKAEPDVKTLRREVYKIVAEKMTPEIFLKIVQEFRRQTERAREDGARDLKRQLKKLLDV